MLEVHITLLQRFIISFGMLWGLLLPNACAVTSLAFSSTSCKLSSFDG
jgi:hypothetical protein